MKNTDRLSESTGMPFVSLLVHHSNSMPYVGFIKRLEPGSKSHPPRRRGISSITLCRRHPVVIRFSGFCHRDDHTTQTSNQPQSTIQLPIKPGLMPTTCHERCRVRCSFSRWHRYNQTRIDKIPWGNFQLYFGCGIHNPAKISKSHGNYADSIPVMVRPSNYNGLEINSIQCSSKIVFSTH